MNQCDCLQVCVMASVCIYVYVCQERAPHHGSRASIRSFYTIILSSKVLLNRKKNTD